VCFLDQLKNIPNYNVDSDKYSWNKNDNESSNKNLKKIVKIIRIRIKCIESHLSDFNKKINERKKLINSANKLSSHCPSSPEHTDNDVS
jgi:peptidoglycan hydrolase CwlO-like protein